MEWEEMIKNNILKFNLDELVKDFQSNNIKGFRAKQVFNWIYRNGIKDFKKMNNLPNDLIKKLETLYNISTLSLERKLIAEDGTQKYLWKTSDDNLVESVFLPYKKEKRYSICVSSQIGCSLGCKFCATGIDGLTRNLETEEIIEQIINMQIDISKDNFGFPPITNIVYMGMGEPFLNYDNVMNSINIINNEKGFNIGHRKITVSTSGIIDKIKKLVYDNNQIGLAVSLNAPNDDLRDYLMPINKKYNLKMLMDAIDFYINKTNRRVTFEYVLIEGSNDKKEHAKQLVKLLKGKLVLVNLILVNPVPKLNIDRPRNNSLKIFKNILDKNKIPTTIRIEKGTNIKAACGQLRSSQQNGG